MTHSLTANGFDASEDGTGCGTPIVPAMVSNGDAHSGFRDEDGLVPELSGTLGSRHANTQLDQQFIPEIADCLQERDSKGSDSNTKNGHLLPVSMIMRQREGCAGGGKGPLLSEEQPLTLASSNDQVLFQRMAVRRLLPEECESLQGFPRNYTRIPWRNKPAEQCPDGPRYKALGNSFAIPCVRWIGRQIEMAMKYSKL